MVEEVNNNVVPAAVVKPVIVVPVKPVVPMKPLPVANPAVPQYSNSPAGNSVKRWALIAVVVVIVIVILSLGFFLLRVVVPSGNVVPGNVSESSGSGEVVTPSAPVAGPVTGEIISLDCSSLPLKVEVKITDGSAEGILFESVVGSEKYSLASMGKLNSGDSKNVDVQIIVPEGVTIAAGDISKVGISAIQAGGVVELLDSMNCAAQ